MSRGKLPAELQRQINRLAHTQAQNWYWLRRADIVAVAWELLNEGNSPQDVELELHGDLDAAIADMKTKHKTKAAPSPECKRSNS